MSQENQNQNNPKVFSNNNNYMSTVFAYIENPSIDLTRLKKVFNSNNSDAAKSELRDNIKLNISLDQIYSTIFDKTILTLINKSKMRTKDHLPIFYILLKENIYRNIYLKNDHKKIGKFIKKFFNCCVGGKNKILTNSNLGEYINFFITELYRYITKNYQLKQVKDATDIENLGEYKIDNFNNLDNIKYIKLLVRYILAFCNILENKSNYVNYHIAIYRIFSSIKEKNFHEYFVKQLYKIYLNKGVYKHGNKFILYIYYPLLYDNKKSQFHFNLLVSDLIKSILCYCPKYYNDNITNIKDKEKGSSLYFLNLVVLQKIMNDLSIDEKLEKFMILKFTDFSNNYMNLFLDDGNQLRVAELILTDTVNKKKFLNHLDKLELANFYINNMDNIDKDKNNWQYFLYLFFDICIDFYTQECRDNKNFLKCKYVLESTNSNVNNSYARSNGPSQDVNNSFTNNISNNISNNSKKDEFENKKIIITKFLNSHDYFIKKYFHLNNIDTNDQVDIKNILEQKKLEELYILLDIIYYASIKFNEEDIVKKSIEDIKQIIILIIKKSYEVLNFNCTIFNFILNIDSKYLPSSNEFDILNSNANILLRYSLVQFIKTYPIFMIFILNYFPKNNYDIKEFFSFLKAFMQGYSNNVFFTIDKNEEKDYNHTLQLNYLEIMIFVLKIILNIYADKINEYEINNNKILHLPYCTKCKKKLKNYILYSNYLSQCFYCGEKYLYINTDLYPYLIKNKENVKKFVEETVFNVITNITCDILYSFNLKYEKKEETTLFSYSLFYKVMKEHFKFLNYIKVILGINIPFVVDIDNIANKTMNSSEGLLEINIDNFFEKLLTNKCKYPFEYIYKTICDDNFKSFNIIRKTIKHESILAMNKYVKK